MGWINGSYSALLSGQNKIVVKINNDNVVIIDYQKEIEYELFDITLKKHR